ncbi:MAG: transposase [Specibacter sp.]
MTGSSSPGSNRPGDPEILVVMDAGHDVTRIAWLRRDLPVVLIARVRSDRVFYAPAGARRGPTMGRAPRHGAKLVLGDPATHPAPACATEHELDRHGLVRANTFEHMHPKLESRGGFKDHQGPLPLIEGTVIRFKVEHLPGSQTPKPLWLWDSKPVPDVGREMDHWWSMCVRRFDLEHTFELPETRPGLDPAPPARTRRGRSLDLDRAGRPHVAAPSTADGR